jgi:hypothetical protein
MARILRFRQVSSLFYYLPSERKLVRVSKKTKEALSIWGDKKKEMALFSDKIGMKKNCSENELINLCKHYDSLL